MAGYVRVVQPTSSVALVYTAVSFLVNGVYLLLPEALMAAVSIWRTTPTCAPATSETSRKYTNGQKRSQSRLCKQAQRPGFAYSPSGRCRMHDVVIAMLANDNAKT